MWYIEIICSKEWLSGNIVPHESIVFTEKMSLFDGKKNYPAEGVVYATNNELHALRMISETAFDESFVNKLTDYNMTYWRCIIENFVRIGGDTLFSIYSLIPNHIMLCYGEGDKGSKPLEVKGQFTTQKNPIDFSILIKASKAFPREHTLYMQYLNRFTNLSIPLEMRWLNGYKIFELHYGFPLRKKNKWKSFLEEYREEIIPLLRDESQSLHGFMATVRNEAAHAVSNIHHKEDLFIKTLPVMEKMLIKFLNILRKSTEIEFRSK
jgi:hypothetical protein